MVNFEKEMARTELIFAERFSLRNCLGFMTNRYGCMIIAFVETLWLCTSLIFAIMGLRQGMWEWISRLDYYKGEVADKSKNTDQNNFGRTRA